MAQDAVGLVFWVGLCYKMTKKRGAASLLSFILVMTGEGNMKDPALCWQEKRIKRWCCWIDKWLLLIWMRAWCWPTFMHQKWCCPDDDWGSWKSEIGQIMCNACLPKSVLLFPAANYCIGQLCISGYFAAFWCCRRQHWCWVCIDLEAAEQD